MLGLPRDRLAQQGTGGEVAYDLLTNELLLDGAARLNLATADLFLDDLRKQTTWLESLASPLPGRDPRDHQSFAH